MATADAARTCRNLIKPSSFLSPIVGAAPPGYQNGFRERCGQIFRVHKPSVVACHSSSTLSGPISLSTRGSHKEHAFSTGTSFSQFSSTSSSLLGGDQEVLSYTNPVLPSRHRSPIPPRAISKDVFTFKIPVMTEKPEWWWRTLACVPYLLALQMSEVGGFVFLLSEHYKLFENLIYFVPGALNRWPSWLHMVYCYFAFIGIVKNKEWSHFIRFHVMMGMLLETALQILWFTCNLMPLINYTSGTFRVQFWAAVGFSYIAVMLQCVKCALAGSYVYIPFISDAAYIHTLFNIGSFQRPF